MKILDCLPSIVLATLIGIAAAVSQPKLLSGLNELPPLGDSMWYDNLAVSLVSGHGYGLFWGDSEWRRPYLERGQPEYAKAFGVEGRWDPISTLEGPFYRATFPGPLFATTVALEYLLFGRKFYFVRLVNLVFLIVSLTAIFAMARRRFGAGVANLTFLFALLDASYFFKPFFLFLSEPLSCLLCSLLLLAALRFSQNRSPKQALWLGILLAANVLTRTFLVVWVPFLACWQYFSAQPDPENSSSRGLLQVIAGAAICFGLIFPWCFRNHEITGSYSPSGYQTGLAIGQAYSEGIVQSAGVWTDRTHRALFQRFYEEYPDEIADRLASNYGFSAAEQWIRENSIKLPWLLWLKGEAFLRELSLSQQLLLVLSMLVLVSRYRELLVVHVLIMGVVSVVMLTYTDVDGRFLFPLQPALYLTGAVGLKSFLSRFGRRGRN